MENELKNYGDCIAFVNSLKNKIVRPRTIIWDAEDGYVYKLRSDDYDNLEDFKRELDIKNSIEEFEKCELVGYVTRNGKMLPIIKQKKLATYVDIIIKFLKDHGYNIVAGNHETICEKNGIRISDLYYTNVGLDENNNIKFLDINVDTN